MTFKNLDEITELYQAIQNFNPCLCGAIRPSTQQPIIHKANCPLEQELIKRGIREIK